MPLPFDAEVRVHPRAVRMRLRVHPGGRVTVTIPRGRSFAMIPKFLLRHRAWIERTRARLMTLTPLPSRDQARTAYVRHKEAARRLVYAKIAQYAVTYGVSVRGVSVRDQKTRWGSCSRAGRLSFNYRLALLPERLAEYVVVHELCHLLEFNHSPRFWAQVARSIPEHARIRKQLRQVRMTDA